MIVFLNFAPLSFAGGAERWMVDVASEMQKKEPTLLVDVHPSIANIYGSLVLKRTYDTRVSLTRSNENFLTLTFLSFLPFTSYWKKARQALHKARTIYIRFEFLEAGLVWYFGGKKSLKKTIAGVHSPFVYHSPQSFLQKLHNLLYTSPFSKWILSRMHKVHVLNSNDLSFFTKQLQLQNVFLVPNFVAIKRKINQEKFSSSKLHIAFIGELNERKGFDILLQIMKKKKTSFMFHIAGDGPMKEEIEKLLPAENIKYYGYLQKSDINLLYEKCDVLFIPSRAESFSLASLEAMSYGLPLISSEDTKIGLPDFVQEVNTSNTTDEYLAIFQMFLTKKAKGLLHKQHEDIREFIKQKFSKEVVLPSLIKTFFTKS